MSVDRLIDALWGEHAPASARSVLHVHLSKLRTAVGDLLITSPAGYLLQTDAYELDADRFASLVQDGRRDPTGGRRRLAEALDLWRGEPLTELAAEGPIGDWRRALAEQRLEATMLWIDAELAAGAAEYVVTSGAARTPPVLATLAPNSAQPGAARAA
jgi:DNA-binding SARP family transcriptional activator